MTIKSGMITVFVVRPNASGRSHEFLQLLRAPNVIHGGTWQVVRGKVEPGESFLAAGVRELREETGLKPQVYYRVGTVETFYTSIGDTIWHSVPFLALIDRDEQVTLNHEHTDFRWIPRDQMDAHVMWASERQLLKDLCHDILDRSPAEPMLRIDIDEVK
jgi:dATP pyrophosphohydrolase